MARLARDAHQARESPADIRLVERKTAPQGPDYQAYQVLHFGYTLLPLAVGIDKFFQILTNWDQYLAPQIPNMLGISGHTLMLVSGAGEIGLAIGVALKPRLFAYLACAWLLGIVFNLLLTSRYFDIALRDFGLALGAFALARLSTKFD